jgi:hypothetical protein
LKDCSKDRGREGGRRKRREEGMEGRGPGKEVVEVGCRRPFREEAL